MNDYGAACNRTFKAYHDDGDRDVSSIRWIVLHDTEGSSAVSAARYFTLPKSGGSAHLVVDDTECYRCLNNTDIPRAAPGANVHGFHIEQAGFARWATSAWLLHRDTLKRAAYKTAWHLVLFNLPPTFRTADGLKKHLPGVTTHKECTKAFGGDHSDPGLFWPRRYFMGQVRGFYDELTT